MKVIGIALGLISLSTPGLAASNVATNRPSPGVIQKPSNGSKALTLQELPAPIRHAAEAALSGLGNNFTLTSADLDLDEALAIYEIQAISSDGRRVEVDVEPSGTIEELEIEIRREEIPAAVLEALGKHAPDLQPSQDEGMYEKSLRPSRSGLLEIWYEFSGKNFDVEIRSDAQRVLIEPA